MARGDGLFKGVRLPESINISDIITFAEKKRNERALYTMPIQDSRLYDLIVKNKVWASLYLWLCERCRLSDGLIEFTISELSKSVVGIRPQHVYPLIYKLIVLGYFKRVEQTNWNTTWGNKINFVFPELVRAAVKQMYGDLDVR